MIDPAVTSLASAVISAAALVVVALVNARTTRIDRRTEKIETKVDGTHTAMIAEQKRLATESALREGQLMERDRTEARADQQADKKGNES